MSAGGQRVAITAAANGIGLVIARTFAAAGASVQVCDVDAGAVEALDEPGITATTVDVADGDALDSWLDGALSSLGGLDVLVCNAGISGPTAAVEDVAPADWERCLAVGLTSHFRACARVVPTMKQAGSGSIVAISSTAGLFGLGRRTPYTATKWGVIGLVKALAVELGPHGIRVNAVCPGSVEGPRIRGVLGREAEARGIPLDTVVEETLAGQSIRRFVAPEEVADLCLYLASDGARMVNGQAIAVDGHTETFHIG